jgi:hypothetical protein
MKIIDAFRNFTKVSKNGTEIFLRILLFHKDPYSFIHVLSAPYNSAAASELNITLKNLKWSDINRSW